MKQFTQYLIFTSLMLGMNVLAQHQATEGTRTKSGSEYATQSYLAAIRVLDRHELASEKSREDAWNLDFISSSWASSKSCLIAGWEGSVSANGHCKGGKTGFAKAKAKCEADEGPVQHVPCNPAIFGIETGCIPISKSETHWTQACEQAMTSKVGGADALRNYLADHPEVVKKAVQTASSVCSQVSNRKDDVEDCAILKDFLSGGNRSVSEPKEISNCTKDDSVLGSGVLKCVSEAKDALQANAVNSDWGQCSAKACREKLLRAEIDNGLKTTLAELEKSKGKLGSEASTPLAMGKCELNLSYHMLQPYDDTVDSIKDSKLKPQKTLVLKIQNDLHYHAFFREPDLSGQLLRFASGANHDTTLYNTIRQSAYDSCFEGR